MKINKISEEKMAPEWVFNGNEAVEFSNSEYITSDEALRISNISTDINEDALIEERDYIEKCATDGSLYHYNSKWPEDIKRSLKEYAMVCGMDMSKFQAVDPEKISHESQSDYGVYFSEKLQEKLSEKGVHELDQLSNKDQRDLFKAANKGWESKNEDITMLNDPFKLEEKSDMSHMSKANWEDVKGQSNLADKPSMTSSVRPVRGGENYFENSFSNIARGQNSISDADAIKTMVECETEDNGARLRRENQEKTESKKAEHKRWEDEKIASMEKLEIVPKGNVFPTESMNAQSGIKAEPFDFSTVPEKTDGEKIAEANEQRRKVIQGQKKEKHEFELNKAPTRQISDTFAESLKKALSE